MRKILRVKLIHSLLVVLSKLVKLAKLLLLHLRRPVVLHLLQIQVHLLAVVGRRAVSPCRSRLGQSSSSAPFSAGKGTTHVLVLRSRSRAIYRREIVLLLRQLLLRVDNRLLI